ncbi:unnamed protein product [Rhizoctonia solani]|uniref:Uncharacterized protein n=1 Tax=Rhizoctonia solani TaxID=456999 RepID=A0A8H2Y0J8_9AGAM|nr:unnamed protein product [Rhizoctonia solani]
MTSGTNWMGGRGHVKKAKGGLKLLERGGDPEQHFAKLRAVTSNLIVPDPPSRKTNSKATPFVSLKHAQLDTRGPVPVHAVTGAENDPIHSSSSALPHIIDKPNKPTKQSRLPELVETAVRNIESLDAKRAHINSIDARTLAGLDVTSRKRKYGIALDGQDQVASKPFYYPMKARPRAFAASPSPEPHIIMDTCAEQVEDMLSFGTPSDRQSTNGTQASTIHSNGQTQDEQTVERSQTMADAPPVSTMSAEPQSSTKEIEIPHTLYEDAFRAAAQTLKLQDALLGVQTNATLTPWITRSNKNDSEIRSFNLFAPAEVDILDGIPPDPEPRMAVTFQRDHKQNVSSGALDEENRLSVGNQTGNNSRQDHDRQAENSKVSDLPVRPHGKPRMGPPKGTKPPSTQIKPAGEIRTNSGRGSMALSPLDRYVLRSHPSHSRRTSDQVKLSSDHSNVHGKANDREPIVTTRSASKLDSVRIALDFASAESSPSPSQEIGLSLTTGEGNSRTIGLQLFDDHSQANVEADA